MILKVAVYQMEDRGDAKNNINEACRKILCCNADFFCLPEYFAIPANYKKSKGVEDAWKEITKPALEKLSIVSKTFPGYIIAGTLVEKSGKAFYNTCFIFKSGKIVGKHRKVNLIDEEVELGLTPGVGVEIFFAKSLKFSVLICADGLRKDLLRKAAEAKIVFFPTSMTDPKHKVRGQPVFQKIAKEYGIVIVKASRIFSNGGSKSAVITPTTVYETRSYDDELLVVDLIM